MAPKSDGGVSPYNGRNRPHRAGLGRNRRHRHHACDATEPNLSLGPEPAMPGSHRSRRCSKMAGGTFPFPRAVKRRVRAPDRALLFRYRPLLPSMTICMASDPREGVARLAHRTMLHRSEPFPVGSSCQDLPLWLRASSWWGWAEPQGRLVRALWCRLRPMSARLPFGLRAHFRSPPVGPQCKFTELPPSSVPQAWCRPRRGWGEGRQSCSGRRGNGSQPGGARSP